MGRHAVFPGIFFHFSQELTGSVAPCKKVTFCEGITRSRALLILKAFLMIQRVVCHAMELSCVSLHYYIALGFHTKCDCRFSIDSNDYK